MSSNLWFKHMKSFSAFTVIIFAFGITEIALEKAVMNSPSYATLEVTRIGRSVQSSILAAGAMGVVSGAFGLFYIIKIVDAQYTVRRVSQEANKESTAGIQRSDVLAWSQVSCGFSFVCSGIIFVLWLFVFNNEYMTSVDLYTTESVLCSQKHLYGRGCNIAWTARWFLLPLAIASFCHMYLAIRQHRLRFSAGAAGVEIKSLSRENVEV